MSDTRTVTPPQPTAPLKGIRRLRLLAQSAAFLLFLFLLLATRQNLKTVVSHDLFFLADPLAGLSAMLAGRQIIVPMLIGGTVLLTATLLAGRAWCGWLCPLGSLLDWIPGRRARRDEADVPGFWRHSRTLVLLLVVLGAALGSLTLIFLDPVTLVFRSLAAAVLPLLNSAMFQIDTWLFGIGLLQGPVGWLDSSVRVPLLGDPGFHLPNLTLLAFFLGILALNAVRRRFWCRSLCPLGALLGFVSKISVFRHRNDRNRCISCGRCSTQCHTRAIDPERGYSADPGECTACLECIWDCPTRAISFSRTNPLLLEYEPARRHFFQSVGLGAIGAVAIALLPTPGRRKQTLIRPPGSTEESLATRCIRCGECIKVCPTGSIQPALSAATWDKTWSPHLVMRRGYCDYSCNSCGRVCPTGAITTLALEEKRVEVIGVAEIREKRCIPFADDRECIVCEEMCPLPEKAIVLKNEPGRTAARPHVLADVCTGCGICEEQCPLDGDAAIVVMPPGTVFTETEDHHGT